MRSPGLLLLFLLPALALTGCDNNGACLPDPPLPCKDQDYARVNLLAGRLSDQLYTLDVAQILLVKGASDRFMSTVADHDTTYTKQEIHDAMQSAILVAGVSDSITSLLATLNTLADTLDGDNEWAPLFREWKGSIEEALLVGDNLLQMLAARAESVTCETALSEAAMDISSLLCVAEQIAPGCDSLACLFEETDKGGISAFLPTMLSCTPAWWSDGWGVFVRNMVKSCEMKVEPFLGPVGLHHLTDDILASETGWTALEMWASDPGSIRVNTTFLGNQGTALAVLVPDGEELRGSYYHPLLLSAPTDLTPVPSGKFRLLIFSPFQKPYASPPFDVEPGVTTTIQPIPVPMGDEECLLGGGEIPLWVVDPRSDEHISNDFNGKCLTEFWDGSTLFQLVFPIDTLISRDVFFIRTEADFRFAVDCDDQTVSGTIRGAVSLIPFLGDECTAVAVEPDSVTIQIDGIRTLDGIFLSFTCDPSTHIATVACSGEEYSRDISPMVFPYREVDFTLGNTHSAETTMPVGATTESPVFFEMEIHRVF